MRAAVLSSRIKHFFKERRMVRVLLVSVMVSVVAAAGVGTFVSRTARAAEAEKKAAAVLKFTRTRPANSAGGCGRRIPK